MIRKALPFAFGLLAGCYLGFGIANLGPRNPGWRWKLALRQDAAFPSIPLWAEDRGMSETEKAAYRYGFSVGMSRAAYRWGQDRDELAR